MERLLEAADELFYGEGVNTVGHPLGAIARAGVAKASLYTNFGSKDELIRAYLDRRHKSRRERALSRRSRAMSPLANKILAVFDQLGDLRGCPFIRAGAEAPPGSLIEEANDAYRRWLRSLFQRLARDAGASDPTTLAVQLQILYDGAAIGGRMDRNPRAGEDGADGSRVARRRGPFERQGLEEEGAAAQQQAVVRGAAAAA